MRLKHWPGRVLPFLPPFPSFFFSLCIRNLAEARPFSSPSHFFRRTQRELHFLFFPPFFYFSPIIGGDGSDDSFFFFPPFRLYSLIIIRCVVRIIFNRHSLSFLSLSHLNRRAIAFFLLFSFPKRTGGPPPCLFPPFLPLSLFIK